MTQATEEFAASEVLAKADKWEGFREATRRAAPHEKARVAGQYKESGRELARAVVKYREAGTKRHNSEAKER